MRYSEIAHYLRGLPVTVPDSSSIVETRFRKRLALAVEASGVEVDKAKKELLVAGMFIEGLKPDDTKLNESELALMAEAIAAHATAIFYPAADNEAEALTSRNVIEDQLRSVVATPAPLRAKEAHPDSLEVAARLLRAEELLSEIDALIEPILNNPDERGRIENISNRHKTVLNNFWPSKHDEVAENARTPRRAEWMANLVDIVDHHWNEAAAANKTRPPTKERIREVSANIAKLLGISNPPTTEGLRGR